MWLLCRTVHSLNDIFPGDVLDGLAETEDKLFEVLEFQLCFPLYLLWPWDFLAILIACISIPLLCIDLFAVMVLFDLFEAPLCVA